ncbi:unnamed protein product [Effrenium voratum]|nr:unnamed protein product [Effrenium voratum]
MAYLLRRIPQCGEFFAKPLQNEPWLEGDAPLVGGGKLSDLVGNYSVNVLLRLLTTTLFLASSRHAAWLLAILHALMVPQKQEEKDKKEPAEQQSLERWSKINKEMHAVLSQESVLSLCRFLCQAGSGHGSSGEADTFQMAGEILVALAASPEHLAMVRTELMTVLAYLVTNIEADLVKCEPGSADPSTMETRLLRLVRTLAEVFKEAAKASPKDAEDRGLPAGGSPGGSLGLPGSHTGPPARHRGFCNTRPEDPVHRSCSVPASRGELKCQRIAGIQCADDSAKAAPESAAAVDRGLLRSPQRIQGG